MSLTKRRTLIISILLISVFFSNVVAINSSFHEMTGDKSKLHISDVPLGINPIVIMSDSELDQFILDFSFNGTGTLLDPYIINYTKFEFSFNETTVGIHIENITKYLVVEDIIVRNTNSTMNGIGIEILADNIGFRNITVQNTRVGIDLKGNDLIINETAIEAEEFGIKAIDCISLKVVDTNVTGANFGMYLESCVNPLIMNNEIKDGQNGIQIFGTFNFRIEGNLIQGNSERGLLVVEFPIQSGMYNIITRNLFLNNGVQAAIVEINGNTLFYDIATSEGNLWSDWRRWGKYKVQDDVYDLYPMKMVEGELVPANLFSFKFWFWIFAPTLIVLGAVAYLFYWKFVIQPTKE